MANEKRLIDANAFECVCVNGKSDDFCNGVLYVLDMIDAQPTVDAVEVVHGRWVEEEEEQWLAGLVVIGYRCSVCGSGYGCEFNYCPNCGAEMRERKGNET